MTRRHSKLWRSWLLSFMSVWTIPALAAVVIYAGAARIAERQLVAANEIVLQQVRSLVDSSLEAVHRAAIQVAMNPRVGGLLFEQRPLGSASHYRINRIQRDLVLASSPHPYIRDIVLHAAEPELFVTSTTTATVDLAVGATQTVIPLSVADWQRISGSSHGTEMVFGDRDIILVQPLPLFEKTMRTGLVAVLLDAERLLEPLFQFASEQSRRIAVERHGEGVNLARYLRPAFADEYLVSTADPTERFLTARIDSAVTNWTYVIGVSRHAYEEGLSAIRTIAVVALAVSALIGGLVAVFLARRHYGPVVDLMQIVTEPSEPADVQPGQSEYVTIQSGIRRVQRQLQQQRALMRDVAISRLLYSRADEESLGEDSALAAALRFPSDRFVVAVTSGDESSSVIVDDLRSAIAPIAEVEVIHTGGLVVLLLVLRSEVMGHTDVTSAILKEYCHERGDANQGAMGVSGAVTGTEQIPQAYRQALDAFDMSRSMPERCVVTHDDVQARQRVVPFDSSDEHSLEMAVRTGHQTEANAIVDELFRRLETGERFSRTQRRLLSVHVSLVIHRAATCSVPGSAADTVAPPLVEHFTGEPSHDRECLQELIHAATTRTTRPPPPRGAVIAGKIETFIEQEFANQALNVAYVAEHLSLTPSYVSKVFREETNEELLHAIHRVRCTHAVDLLARTDDTIEAIARSVGYPSAAAFIRRFRRTTGKTPGAFRRLSQSIHSGAR